MPIFQDGIQKVAKWAENMFPGKLNIWTTTVYIFQGQIRKKKYVYIYFKISFFFNEGPKRTFLEGLVKHKLMPTYLTDPV